MSRERIFTSYCSVGEDEIEVIKTAQNDISICCSGDDGEANVILMKDSALKLAQAIFDSYK